jgi:hypothetical protein
MTTLAERKLGGGMKVDRSKFKELERQALELADVVDKSYLGMVKVLAGIKEQFDLARSPQEAKKELGFECFNDWVKGRFAFKQRQARYLLDVWDNLHVKAHVSMERIEQIGMSKAKLLASAARKGALGPDTRDVWLDKADKMTHDELRDAAKKAVTPKGEKVPETQHRVTVTLFEDQFRTWQDALETAKALTGSEQQCHLVSMICLEFIAHHNKGEKREDLMLRLAAAMERAFDVRLILFDKKKAEVVYGQKMVRSILAEEGDK